MNILKKYSTLSRLSYRTWRTFASPNKPFSSSQNDHNNFQSGTSENQGRYSEPFNTQNRSQGSSGSSPVNDFISAATSTASNVVNTATNIAGPAVLGIFNTVSNIATNVAQSQQGKPVPEVFSAMKGVGDAAASVVNNVANVAGSVLFSGNTSSNTSYYGTQVKRGFSSKADAHGNEIKHQLYDVVISGAGPAGCALACALAHYGYFTKEDKRIVLLDPVEPPSIDQFHTKNVIPDQRVVSLSLASVNFLKELGVWDLVNQDRIGTINQMQVWENGGNSFIKFNENPAVEIGYVIETNHLQAALYERLKQLGNVKLELPNKITDLHNDEGIFPTVVLDKENKISARLIIGSDGINSIVKKKAKIASTGWSCLQHGIVATVKTPFHNTTAWQRFLSTGPLAVLPLWDEYSSIVWSCESGLHSALLQANDEDFLRELNQSLHKKPIYNTPNLVLNQSASFDLPPLITEVCNKRRSFPLSMGQANQFVAPRIALIGDAAHNIHPLAGQGLNMGLTDAAYLSNVIVKNLKIGNDIGNEDLLREYETASMRLNSTMMYSLEFIKRFYENNDNSPSVLFRNLATATINNLAPVKSMFIDAANGKYSQPESYEWKKL